MREVFVIVVITSIVFAVAIFPLSQLVNGQLENIPNPDTNGDITIKYAIQPYGSSDSSFVMILSTFQMYFSKQNLSLYDTRVMDGSLTSKNPVSFNFAFHLLQNQYDNISITTLQKSAEGYFSIYKVQDFPQYNERYYYGSGTLHIGSAWWFDTQGVFMERTSAPFYYGVSVNGQK
jgi:hypothetical protein